MKERNNQISKTSVRFDNMERKVFFPCEYPQTTKKNGGIGDVREYNAFTKNKICSSCTNHQRPNFCHFQGAAKSQTTIIFASAIKIGGNPTNILNCYFSKQIYPSAHQTKYLHRKLNLSSRNINLLLRNQISA